MYKIDFHTHSITSPDGSIRPAQYRTLLNKGTLDVVAITDHDRIDTARTLHAELPKSIIIGEEVTTTEGEIIGLYLHEAIPPGLSAKKTMEAIRAQGGLVYIPHPFETLRKGLPIGVLDSLAKYIDIVEVANGRAVFQNRSPQAIAWAAKHRKVIAGSSDAHGASGVGYTYTEVAELPTRQSLLVTLQSAMPVFRYPPMHSLLYPKFNRARKKLKRSKP